MTFLGYYIIVYSFIVGLGCIIRCTFVSYAQENFRDLQIQVPFATFEQLDKNGLRRWKEFYKNLLKISRVARTKRFLDIVIWNFFRY